MTIVFLNSLLSRSSSVEDLARADLRSRSPVGSSASSSVGIADDRARDRDALLLAARELARVVVDAVAEPDELERVLRALRAAPCPLIVHQQQRQLDVLRAR